MKLAQLFSPFGQFKMGEDPLCDITGIITDSRKVSSNHVFVAIRGTKIDGHTHLAEACSGGAAALVVEDVSGIPSHFKGAVLKVKNTKAAIVELAKHFYGYPSDKLFCVGVTGTNGKTSTTYLVEAVLNQFGLKTGVIGTINHHFQDKVWESELTTPDPITLQKRLGEFVVLGAKAAAFEISSHGLDQGRADGIEYSCAIFTNLTRDHLDYHETMENYFAAKERLFLDVIGHQSQKQAVALINIDDDWGKKIRVSARAQVWTYGESKSDLQFQILSMNFSGTRFRLMTSRGETEFQSPLIGRHNVYNSVAAIGAALIAGSSLESCAKGIAQFTGVPGRLQRVKASSNNGPTVFIDYAHTDDALRTVLEVLGQVRAQNHEKNKVITVFGCGGDRDRGKRPLMAQAALEGSDVVIVTSDNPRSEDPLKIVQDILSGVPKDLMNSKVFVEIDRREAIRRAIEMSHPRDVVLIAGKGHEDYQIIGDKKHDFSDLKVAGEIISGL